MAHSKSLFSWPSNPALTSLHLLTRAAIVATNAVGLSVSYAAAVNTETASFWVAGSFMSCSLLFFQPVFLIWNKRQLRRGGATTSKKGYQQLQSDENTSPTPSVSTKFLEFAVAMDIIAVLGYWITWGFTIQESTTYRYWGYDHGITVLESYAGVATLVCALMHSILLITELLQLRSAYRVMKTTTTVCPHCHHSLSDMPGSPKVSGAAFSTMSGQPSESQNLLGQDDYTDADEDARTTIDMSPGQETGICAVTPRVSTAGERLRSDSAATANETSEGEGDRLIEKIACDLQSTTSGRWLDRVIPHLA